MNLKLKATLAAVAMVFAANSANAASTASATLGPINVTLIDLNLADNIAPTITWANNYYGDGFYYDYGDVNAYAVDTAVNNYQSSNQVWGENNFSNVSASSTTALSSANAGIIGADDSKPDGATLSASGNAQGTTTIGEYSAFDSHSYALYSYSNQFKFTLGAYTRVLFSAAATADAATTVGYQSGWGSEYSYAFTTLGVLETVAGGNSGSQSSWDDLSAYAGYTSSSVWNSETNQYEVTYSGEQKNLTGTLAVSYTNSTGQDKVGNFSGGVVVYGTSYVPAVPEPNTYAMLLAGLGLIGFMARRRK